MSMHACSVMSYSLWPHGLQPARLLCQWDFSRKTYWSGLPFPPPGDLPDLGIKPASLVSPALAGRFFTIEPLAEAWFMLTHWLKMDSNGFISIQSTSHIGEIFTVKPNELLLMAGSFLQQLMAFIWNKKSINEFHDNLFWQ